MRINLRPHSHQATKTAREGGRRGRGRGRACRGPPPPPTPGHRHTPCSQGRGARRGPGRPGAAAAGGLRGKRGRGDTRGQARAWAQAGSPLGCTGRLSLPGLERGAAPTAHAPRAAHTPLLVSPPLRLRRPPVACDGRGLGHSQDRTGLARAQTALATAANSARLERQGRVAVAGGVTWWHLEPNTGPAPG